MPDETPKPKRKRWRWIIAGVLLFAVIATVYRLRSWSRHADLVAAAKQITIGASEAEAARILANWNGYKTFDGDRTTTLRFGPISKVEWGVRSWLNKFILPQPLRPADFPIVVICRDDRAIKVDTAGNDQPPE